MPKTSQENVGQVKLGKSQVRLGVGKKGAKKVTKKTVRKVEAEVETPKVKPVQALRREIVGTVVSAKAAKTVAVILGRTWIHPLYRKRLTRHTRVLAHDELGAKEGERVGLLQSRPISKRKKWIVSRVLGR